MGAFQKAEKVYNHENLSPNKLMVKLLLQKQKKAKLVFWDVLSS